MGLTVYVASQYPYMSGFDYPGPGGPTDATNYFAPFTMLTIAPDFVFEGDYYLIAGDVGSARQIVYELHQAASAPDLFAPFGATDTPMPGSNVSGVIQVAGWAFDDVNVTKVEILVDGTADGAANYGPLPSGCGGGLSTCANKRRVFLRAEYCEVQQRNTPSECACYRCGW
jgi:hypothetical protein